MELTDAQIRAIGDRIQRDQASAMQRQVQGWVRDYLGTGLPAGQYGSFVWDGRRIVGGSAGLVAIASSTSGQSIPSGGFTRTRIDYNTITYDPLSTITTGVTTWAFTAPARDQYRFDFSLILRDDDSGGSQAWTAGDVGYLYPFVNGVEQAVAGHYHAPSANNAVMMMQGMWGAVMDAGDTFYLTAMQISAGSLARLVDLSVGGTWLFVSRF